MYKKESFYNADGEEVYSKTTQFKGRFRDEGYMMYAHGQTISRRTSLKFPGAMTKIDIANLDLLAAHLLPITNVIGYRTKKGNQPMSVEQMGKVIGVQQRQAYRFIKRMIDMRMIAKDGEQHVINPLYFLNGRIITDRLYWLFEDSLKDHLNEWVQKAYRERGGG